MFCILAHTIAGAIHVSPSIVRSGMSGMRESMLLILSPLYSIHCLATVCSAAITLDGLYAILYVSQPDEG